MRKELNEKAKSGQAVFPGGTMGGQSGLEATTENLSESRSPGGGHGHTRGEQNIGTQGGKEMGRKGDLSATDKSGGGEKAAEGSFPVDEIKFRRLP
ncbi:hypothetical protein SOVF_147130 [Spinacia oleracea]|nr:hypothetical protein SOVF_147130 [Spinacia oleracea]